MDKKIDDFMGADVFREKYLWQGAGLYGKGEKVTVIHMGACSSTTETDADFIMDNNFIYTCELAKWCLEQGYRLIYASSAATYGNGENGYSDECDLWSLRPLNVYGYSKHLFDIHASKRGWLDKMAGLKFFNVFGPYEDHKDDMRSVVNKAYEQIGECGYVKLFKSYRKGIGDGEQRRDFVYVKDAVEQIIYLATHPEINGLFNMGTGTANTFKDLGEQYV